MDGANQGRGETIQFSSFRRGPESSVTTATPNYPPALRAGAYDCRDAGG